MYYQQAPPPVYQPQYSGCLKFILYVLSFCIPLVGIIVGIIFMSKGNPEASSLGKTCLIISIVAIVIGCCVGVGFSVVPIILESAGVSTYY
jgi:hypothetical protein